MMLLKTNLIYIQYFFYAKIEKKRTFESSQSFKASVIMNFHPAGILCNIIKFVLYQKIGNMKNRIISFSFKEYENAEELKPADRELLFAARDIMPNAYAPYSKFMVGAAIRLASNKIIRGVNVENAAFPSGICAERSALSNSVSNFPGDIPIAIAVAAMTSGEITEDPVPPCGNCRQVLAEEETKNGNKIRVIISGKNRIYIIDSVSRLLPIQFRLGKTEVILPE